MRIFLFLTSFQKCDRVFLTRKHLQKHDQKCTRCVKCKIVFPSLLCFARHVCALKRKREVKFTNPKRAKSIKTMEEKSLENIEVKEIRDFLPSYCRSIRTYYKPGPIQDQYNFLFCNINLENSHNRIIPSQRSRFKIDYSFGFVLRYLKITKCVSFTLLLAVHVFYQNRLELVTLQNCIVF